MAGINDIDSSIQNLIKMTNGKAMLVKAYENPSVSSSFPNQKLPINLSDCDLVAVIGVLIQVLTQDLCRWSLQKLD